MRNNTDSIFAFLHEIRRGKMEFLYKNLSINAKPLFPKMEDQSYILKKRAFLMKFLASLHNPKSKNYVIYYCAILVIASILVISFSLQIIHLSAIEATVLFFEGFFSIFMLVRNKQVRESFMSNITLLKVI